MKCPKCLNELGYIKMGVNIVEYHGLPEDWVKGFKAYQEGGMETYFCMKCGIQVTIVEYGRYLSKPG